MYRNIDVYAGGIINLATTRGLDIHIFGGFRALHADTS